MKCSVESILGVTESDLVRMSPDERARAFLSASANQEGSGRDDGGYFVHATTGRKTPLGKFEAVTISELRRRVGAMTKTGEGGTDANYSPGSDRKGVPLSTASGIDIGELQGNLSTSDDAMVQVASNFNCLENPSRRVRPDYGGLVDNACMDRTQGPAAAFGPLSAYLYRAHFTPTAGTADAHPTNLLRNVSKYFGVPENGKLYLRGEETPLPRVTSDHHEIVDKIVDDICVGLHADCPVIFGRKGGRVYRNDARGENDDATMDDRYPVVDQVFNSTVNLGDYGKMNPDCVDAFFGGDEEKALHNMARVLLRAAYEGAYLSAIARRRRVLLLTLVGGGSFMNPIPIIAQEIQRAHDRWSSHPASVLEKVQICLYSEYDEQQVREALPDTKGKTWYESAVSVVWGK